MANMTALHAVDEGSIPSSSTRGKVYCFLTPLVHNKENIGYNPTWFGVAMYKWRLWLGLQQLHYKIKK